MLLLAPTSFILALYSYFPARIFIPPLTLFLLISYRKQLVNKKGLATLLLLIGLSLPMAIHLFWGPGMARWEQVSNGLELHNIINNYLAHYSLNYLFLKGDIGFPEQLISRHSIKGIGELYFFQFPFLIIGILYLLKQIKKKANRILLFLLLTYPIADSLTSTSSPQATRSVIGLLPLNIITALGITIFLKLYRGKIFSIAAIFIISAIAASFGSFIQKLDKYPLYSADYWDGNPDQNKSSPIFLIIGQNMITNFFSLEFNAPSIFFKFYDPQSECTNCHVEELKNLKRQKATICIRYENLDSWKSSGFRLTLFNNFITQMESLVLFLLHIFDLLILKLLDGRKLKRFICLSSHT